MNRILVIGGAGYVGTVLVNELLKKNYKVTVYDLFIYGNNFTENPNLILEKGDVRDISKIKNIIKNNDIIIHLACISNDPSFELNPKLGKEINLDCFEPLINEAISSGIKKFIYASSSSVYGVKDTKNVTEEMKLEPLTDYSKFKAECENILLSKSNDNFICTVLRPATVCGYSPRQRLDLVVNILTNFAYFKNAITVYGGSQMRPNIHIDDMVNAYICLLEEDTKKIKDQIFNVGFENHSVLDLANLVKRNSKNKVSVNIQETDDNRSYHVSSSKILKTLKFKPKKNIDLAIKDLINAFEIKKLVNTFGNENFFNIKKMQKINLK